MANPLKTSADKVLRPDAAEAGRQYLRYVLPLGIAFGFGHTAHGEDQVAYGYESYIEDNNRMTVDTQSAYFEQKLINSVTVKGELTYDSISGSTPTGTYRISPTSGLIRTTTVNDIRRAMNVALDCQAGAQTLTPGFAYSDESDYRSYGISLNDAIAFNKKNTILQLGASHNFDSVLNDVIGAPTRVWQQKQSMEGLVGITQLLSPKTILSADLTLGYESGFLNDPYRLTEFVYPGHQLGVVRNERRPSYLFKQTLLASITQHVDPLNASLVASYRFYHDSYDIYANTVSLTWNQWVGKHLIVAPAFRFYEQSSASFYEPLFYQNPANVSQYSSDYRLSEFYSFDAGVQITVIVNSHLHINMGYHRYEMHGLDDTVEAMYPKANVYTIGLSLLW
ncbi:MAG TPA: DUF3570 domain-containing protein [Verrucomicrobiae bacterium]|nr:DUF3570 domain-containing protein [Verrucomicrobiae bacterium]